MSEGHVEEEGQLPVAQDDDTALDESAIDALADETAGE